MDEVLFRPALNPSAYYSSHRRPLNLILEPEIAADLHGIISRICQHPSLLPNRQILEPLRNPINHTRHSLPATRYSPIHPQFALLERLAGIPGADHPCRHVLGDDGTRADHRTLADRDAG